MPKKAEDIEDPFIRAIAITNAITRGKTPAEAREDLIDDSDDVEGIR